MSTTISWKRKTAPFLVAYAFLFANVSSIINRFADRPALLLPAPAGSLLCDGALAEPTVAGIGLILGTSVLIARS